MLRRLRICLAALALAAVPALWASGSAEAAEAGTAAPLDDPAGGNFWSGYTALNPPRTPFIWGWGPNYYGWGASANWVQPPIGCGAETNTVASFWAGVGNSSGGPVERAGTDADCSGATHVNYAWYGTSLTSKITFGGAINTGDSMTGRVAYLGGYCTFVVVDNTAGWSDAAVIPLTGTPASTEVVASIPTDGLTPLTKFTTVNFSAVALGGIGSSFDLTQIPAITNSAGTPLNSISALGGSNLDNSFSVSWLRSS
ncbi:hypothetical protein [Streptomyces sp. NPDC008092]|uniref:hypothetical protein n=1 Tax=Streptomyces sp. NPDC008092 TaxID=3364808 RepID=UPI0036F156D4